MQLRKPFIKLKIKPLCYFSLKPMLFGEGGPRKKPILMDNGAPSSVALLAFTRLSEMMAGRHGDDGEGDDYMGDLSLFLPPDLDSDPKKAKP